MTTVKEEKKLNKLSIDIFVPLDTCSCVYESFIQRVFTILLDYMDKITFQTKSLHSEEARKLGLLENCVVLDGKKIITNSFFLKKEIPKLLKEKNLI